MFKDEHHGTVGDLERFDVVIVGGGMAGITLAERLRHAGSRICLIEGGGLDPEAPAQRLGVGENIGHPYFRLERTRFRVFGGSSIRWGGWCRPLDPIDFTARDWVPGSGWPIDHRELASYYTQAATILELETDSFELADWKGRIPDPPSLGDAPLTPTVIQHGSRVDFGERWKAAFAADPRVTVLLHANVVELVLDASSERLDHVCVSVPGGRRHDIRGQTFVLAAGGIENARLLLASRGRDPKGIGNDSDFVGRCFMEHLHVAPASILPDRDHPLSDFFSHELGGRRAAHGVLTPTESALMSSGLGSCSISFSPPAAAMGMIPRLNWPTTLMTASERTARRLRRDYPRIDALARQAVLRRWTARRARAVRRDLRGSGQSADGSAAVAFFRAEQVPNRDSRVLLSGARDALGVPRVRLDWRPADTDLAAVRWWTDQLREVCHARGIGRVLARDGWEDEVIGGPHHIGTTRMSASPQDGVVDADCRVHTVENLYVAGSSVFTTGGHANPSYTVPALALRLADHLSRRSEPSTNGDVPAGAFATPDRKPCPNV